MEKLDGQKSLHAIGYESPSVGVYGINVRKMMCASIYGGTESMDTEGFNPGGGDGGLEDMNIQNLDL